MERSATSHSSAIATIRPKCTASWFVTGSVPGWPRQIGQVRVFGSSPNERAQPQNIFVRVFSWTWISRPMTGSYSGTEELLRLQQRHFDVTAHLEDCEVL